MRGLLEVLIEHLGGNARDLPPGHRNQETRLLRVFHVGHSLERVSIPCGRSGAHGLLRLPKAQDRTDVADVEAIATNARRFRAAARLDRWTSRLLAGGNRSNMRRPRHVT